MRQVLFFFIFLLGQQILVAQPQGSHSASDIQLMLKKLNTAATVLYVAAHPDDENTRLLSYLANERCVKTAYISLTRGDGGQNLIGQDIGPLLGLIRSNELMAARKVDKAEQFFTRAYDFGYSKSPEETFNIWGRENVLDDLVYIIRYFKPDLIITRFATDGSGGHGHHTASAILAEDAFEAAADPGRFTHQLDRVDVWQAHALLYNNAARFRNPNADMSGNIPINVGKYNPLIGRSYGEIAGLSRSMHKSQGFGSSQYKGEIMEYFKPLMGYPVEDDIFDRLETDLRRLKASIAFFTAVDDALNQYNPEAPHEIVEHLLIAYEETSSIQDQYWREIKRKELEDLILACTGTWVEVNASDPTSTAGENINVSAEAITRSPINVALEGIKIEGEAVEVDKEELETGQVYRREFSYKVSDDLTFSGPYWLQSEPVDGLFNISSQHLLENPIDDGHLFADIQLSIKGKPLSIRRPITYRWVDPVRGQQYRLLEIIPEAIVNFTESVIIFPDDSPVSTRVTVKAGKDSIGGRLKLIGDSNLRVEPEYVDFSIDKKDKEQYFEFLIYPSDQADIRQVKAVVEYKDKNLDRSLVKLNYDHIPIQMVFPEAKIKLVTLDIKPKSGDIGYIKGAGDDVASGIRQLGYKVDEMQVSDLDKNDLSGYKAILTGVRAFNTNEDLFAKVEKLNQYIEEGGVLIVQYNTNSWAGPLKGPIGPIPFNVTRARVTDETAEVIIENPEHAVLNVPNKITSEDFDGWIQERGLYFADEWDDDFVAPLAMADPGEDLLKGSLIIAPYGKGYYIYTGLSFFRQIPNGTPGAFRLLSNLLEMGQIEP